MGGVRIDTQMFSEPVEVELPKYAALHRVYGVERRRNSNGIGKKRHVYAIAQWQLPGTTRWLKLRDLVSLMRLAKAVSHQFP